MSKNTIKTYVLLAALGGFLDRKSVV